MPVNAVKYKAHPFLKWAGGKRQLLPQMEAHFPPQLRGGDIVRYAEPFVGSGALFFKIFQSYPVRECLLADSNPELVLVYRTIQEDVEGLIAALRELEHQYLKLSQDKQRKFYYHIRNEYNHQRSLIQHQEFEPAWIKRSANMLFMNRTGYNGLFRVNSLGEFNVPFGRYKNPRLLDAGNLRRVAALLQEVTIQLGDFEDIEPFVERGTLIYFDPPYRPLSPTANFTSYSSMVFDDHQQLRLADFYRRLDAKDSKLMLSNSDPHNVDPKDDFFERAFQGFRIEHLKARRNINRDAGKRGLISELLILNYDPGK